METRPSHYKSNRYFVENNIIQVLDYKNDEFFIDLKNEYLLKNYCWSVAKNGYVVARIRGQNKNVFVQNVIMNFIPNGKKNGLIVDHIDRNPKNNLENNLRLVTISQNNYNKKVACDSSSKIIGVSETEDGTWHYYINVENGKRIGKIVKTFQEAVYNRLLLEKQYLEEFAPQKHLFEEYGV